MVVKWKCKSCGEEKTSTSEQTHQMEWCKCGKSAVDVEEFYFRYIGETEILESHE